jgi:hypothetical protein
MVNCSQEGSPYAALAHVEELVDRLHRRLVRRPRRTSTSCRLRRFDAELMFRARAGRGGLCVAARRGGGRERGAPDRFGEAKEEEEPGAAAAPEWSRGRRPPRRSPPDPEKRRREDEEKRIGLQAEEIERGHLLILQREFLSHHSVLVLALGDLDDNGRSQYRSIDAPPWPGIRASILSALPSPFRGPQRIRGRHANEPCHDFVSPAGAGCRRAHEAETVDRHVTQTPIPASVLETRYEVLRRPLHQQGVVDLNPSKHRGDAWCLPPSCRSCLERVRWQVPVGSEQGATSTRSRAAVGSQSSRFVRADRLPMLTQELDRLRGSRP